MKSILVITLAASALAVPLPRQTTSVQDTCSNLPFWKNLETMGVIRNKQGIPSLDNFTPKDNKVVISVETYSVELQDIKTLAEAAKKKWPGVEVSIDVFALQVSMKNTPLRVGKTKCYECTAPSRCGTPKETIYDSRVPRIFDFPEGVNLNLFAGTFESAWNDNSNVGVVNGEKFGRANWCTPEPREPGLIVAGTNSFIAMDISQPVGFTPAVQSNGGQAVRSGGLNNDQTNVWGNVLRPLPLDMYTRYYTCARVLMGVNGNTTSEVGTTLMNQIHARLVNLDTRFHTPATQALGIQAMHFANGAGAQAWNTTDAKDALSQDLMMFLNPVMGYNREALTGLEGDDAGRVSSVGYASSYLSELSLGRSNQYAALIKLAENYKTEFFAFNASVNATRQKVFDIVVKFDKYMQQMTDKSPLRLSGVTNGLATHGFVQTNVSITSRDAGGVSNNAVLTDRYLNIQTQKAWTYAQEIHSTFEELTKLSQEYSQWPSDVTELETKIKEWANPTFYASKSGLEFRSKLYQVAGFDVEKIGEMLVKYDFIAQEMRSGWLGIGLLPYKQEMVDAFQALVNAAKAQVVKFTPYFAIRSHAARTLAQIVADQGQSTLLSTVAGESGSINQYVKTISPDLLRIQDNLLDQVNIACNMNPNGCQGVSIDMFNPKSTDATVDVLIKLYGL